MKIRSVFPHAALSAAFALGVTLDGQEESNEDIFELSPFNVTASDEDGYRATNTVAGTRLKTSLDDVAAPISVFTKELLEDVAATDMQDAMLYSVNVENENEFAPDDTEGESVSSTVQTRIRGISAGTQTRGFFKTNYRTDTYNTEVLTVARGPNSILFGLGSPSGVIDSTPIRAFHAKRAGNVGLRFDDNGSARATVNFNVPLIEDKLSVRIAALNQKDKTYRDGEYDDENREFVTFTATPVEGLIVTASYEDMENERVRGRTALMEDRISSWIANGKPLFDHSTGMWTLDNGATWEERSEWSGYLNSGGIGYRDRVHLSDGSLGTDVGQGLVWSSGANSYDRLATPRRTFSDGSLLPTDVNYRGASTVSKLSGDISTLVVEKKFTDDLYLELAYNRERYTRDQDEGLRGGLAGIEADVNFYFPFSVGETTGDLIENPNRGRYMTESEYLGWTQHLETETVRAMLSYSLDFTEGNRKWLGSHNFGLMYQSESTDNLKIKRRMINVGDYFIFGEDGSADIGPNNIKTRYYLDIPSLGGDSNGITTPPVFEPAPWDHVIGSVQEGPQKTRTEIEGALFVTQSAFLDGNLVYTFGYREDEQTAFGASFPERDPVTRAIITDVPFGDTPSIQKGNTKNHGLIFHTPLKGVSLAYNKSNTFNPQGEFFDWHGNPLPPGTGEGEDIGVHLNLLEGKLYARISKYENTSLDAVEFDWYYEEPKWAVVGNMDEDWGMVNGYARRLGNDEDVLVTSVGDHVRATRDFSSEGYEFELFFRPTETLDLRFTLAKTEATNLRVVPLLQDYIDSRMETWEKYFAYPAWGQWTWPLPEKVEDWQNDPSTTGYQLLNGAGALPRVEAFKAEEGSVTTRGRKWRANLIASYDMSETVKGLRLGGAARWRSSNTIGYYGKANPLGGSLDVADIDRPIAGPDVFEIDAWLAYRRGIQIGGKDMDWSLQLNVRNLLNDDGMEPIAAHTDGSYTTWVRKTPRSFILSSGLSF